MAEEVPIASCAPECNGNVIPERGPLQAIGIIDEIAKSVGTVPYANAETGPDTPLTKETQKENRNSVAEKTIRGSSDGEKQCEGKVQCLSLLQYLGRKAGSPRALGPATLRGARDVRAQGALHQEIRDNPMVLHTEKIPLGAGTRSSDAFPWRKMLNLDPDVSGPGEAGVPGRRGERQEARSTAPAEAGRSGCAAEEAEESPAAGAPTPEAKEHTEDEVWLEEGDNATEEEEEEDTEEDEVQLIEIKKENSEESCLKKQENGKEVSPPTSPTCNSQPEKPGEQPGVGKKNDISRHSYSRYNTISYRKIRKGNTKQRIDEFESMMHL
ncbi:ermin [Apteryx mantelli]|uniref:Ermin n=1 Tax=Apteryx mantelli TaxID=2696672 RepID=A0ABM4EPW9_9AVES